MQEMLVRKFNPILNTQGHLVGKGAIQQRYRPSGR
jgi:hypothetical protein